MVDGICRVVVGDGVHFLGGGGGGGFFWGGGGGGGGGGTVYNSPN